MFGKNNFRFFSCGAERVVPLWQGFILYDCKLTHLRVRYLDASFVVSFNEMGLYTQADAGGCLANIVEDGLVTVQRTSRQVFADRAEQAVLDGVPLRCARRVVCDSDGEAMAIAELVLKTEFPRTACSSAVVVATIGEDPEVRAIGITSVVFQHATSV